jgi:hypothetical protein
MLFRLVSQPQHAPPLTIAGGRRLKPRKALATIALAMIVMWIMGPSASADISLDSSLTSGDVGDGGGGGRSGAAGDGAAGGSSGDSSGGSGDGGSGGDGHAGDGGGGGAGAGDGGGGGSAGGSGNFAGATTDEDPPGLGPAQSTRQADGNGSGSGSGSGSTRADSAGSGGSGSGAEPSFESIFDAGFPFNFGV